MVSIPKKYCLAMKKLILLNNNILKYKVVPKVCFR